MHAGNAALLPKQSRREGCGDYSLCCFKSHNSYHSSSREGCISRNVYIHTNDLPFQQSQIPSPTICKLFDEYFDREWNSSILIATDASKGEEGVSLAALTITYNRTLTLRGLFWYPLFGLGEQYVTGTK
ncbi:hypothetical protein AVEN_166507-1 [Araneus ventricosus]|uniref:Uncharacterized protein n=1 Tax=Araneus ventricosus TaxID=182803 RepID=A0A4Y2T4T1_ARAVE|nr:hypothetical protein AVEN_166507-1 [Araneus ventricosus]